MSVRLTCVSAFSVSTKVVVVFVSIINVYLSMYRLRRVGVWVFVN